ncbi:MAG: response regulator [Candidatus Omnitrophica bacterium]|nr:response regulator [Candidatus Omnitrophota bacterium]
MEKTAGILILDDEENILETLKRLFFKETFSIFTTTNYQEALEALKKEEIKVVISDQRMPEITGVEFLKKVKLECPDAVRILMTGHADIRAAEDAINVGEVYRFINKPWNKEDFKGAVCQAVDHYDLVIQNRNLFEETRTKNEELEVLNRKLRDMYEVQKEFTSTVSHELRTPLASMKVTVDLVLSGEPGELNEDQTRFLMKTKNNVDRLTRLINDILDLTKLESGKTQPDISINDLTQTINEVVEIQELAAKEKGLYLRNEIEKRVVNIPFDVDKMHQVLSNLISNAIKFTETGGITVSCINCEKDNCVKISIRDTGQGIKQEDMGKLFQKFQQLGDPRKHIGGTGLGLAICKEIIQCHGGKIWVESEINKGSCFHFILPVQERREG